MVPGDMLKLNLVTTTVECKHLWVCCVWEIGLCVFHCQVVFNNANL